MISLFNLTQIILIDLSMAADNALVVGAAVAALPITKRHKVMAVGIMAATLLRILMAIFATQLLHITGLMAAGGLLLLWVTWKMLRDMHVLHERRTDHRPAHDRFLAAVWQIVIADVSMSLDNVLAVAGVARDHMAELIIGLTLSILLIGLASAQIAKLTARYPKVGYLGAAVVAYTALRMIYDGAQAVMPIHAFV